MVEGVNDVWIYLRSHIYCLLADILGNGMFLLFGFIYQTIGMEVNRLAEKIFYSLYDF